MVARVGGVLLLVLLCTSGVPAINSVPPPAVRPPTPSLTGGVEIEGIRGWFANIFGMDAISSRAGPTGDA